MHMQQGSALWVHGIACSTGHMGSTCCDVPCRTHAAPTKLVPTQDQLFLDQEYTGSVNTTQAVAGRSGATSGPAASTSTGGQARGSPSPTHGPPLEAESTEELGPVPSTGL